MKTIRRALLGLTLFAVTVQTIVAAINWNMTKEWPQYSVETSPAAYAGGRQTGRRTQANAMLDRSPSGRTVAAS